ncbi:MAG: 3'-5' exonuclease [Prevotellaceae bacterium]|jgi:predicted PolB exonuclease-like 3'-5' exonuclease|nr:3'-5' exonuclease [Prevotellaceae bacterium]
MIPNIKNILFIDIETVPQTEFYSDLSADMQQCWDNKFAQIAVRHGDRFADKSASQSFEESAGIYSEFGKIVCISAGFIFERDGKMAFRVTAFADKDEAKLLTDFRNLLLKFCKTSTHTLCGHNIKEFDVPYICRRMIINNIALPKLLQIAGKKPWELNFYDTLDLWKFGDIKNYTSLKLLTAVLGIPTPKDDIDGSMVANVFYKGDNLAKIAAYCQKDVIATMQVFLRLNGIPTLQNDCIEFV